MTPASDPYRDLLGLRRTPRDFYDLLELPRYEADQDRIQRALTVSIERLRKSQSMRHEPSWRSVASRVAAARTTLLDGDRKRQYDQRLRAQTADSAAATQEPGAFADLDPMAPVDVRGAVDRDRASSRPLDQRRDESTTEPPAVIVVSPRQSRRSRKQRLRSSTHAMASRRAYLTACAAFATLIVIGVAVVRFVVLPQRDVRRQAISKLPQSAHDLPLPDVERTATFEPTHDQGSRAAFNEAPARRSRRLSRFADDARPADDPRPALAVSSDANAELSPLNTSQRRQLHTWLSSARLALAERRLSDASKSIQLALDLAEGTESQASTRRLAQLADYVQQFWQAYDAGLAKVQGMDLVVDAQRVHIVDVTDDELVVKALGRVRRFSRNRPPAAYALTVADQWFDPRAASTQVFRGAYMLVTPDFDVEEVRRIWMDAVNAGANLDDLMLVIDDTYDQLLNQDEPVRHD